MKIPFFISGALMLLLQPLTAGNTGGLKKTGEQPVSFTENKGQISDQNYNSRPDVLYSGSANGMAFHLKANGISYQLSRVDAWKKNSADDNKEPGLVPDKTTLYRLDVNWLNCNNTSEVTKGDALQGYSNYYLAHCPEGAVRVKSYTSLLYKNIYPGIDLKWYEKSGQLKYDYLVAAGADYSKIKLELKGAEKLSLNADGELVIKTPLGEIIEQAPLVMQNNKQLNATWIIEANVVSFSIEHINPALPFVIDPVVRTWATYYGDTGEEYGYSCTTDAGGNVYMAGSTQSASMIATVGSHQAVYSGAGVDAYFTKFDSNGNRLWATYYGDNGTDIARSCATDASGFVYICGYTQGGAGTSIATPGSHQPVFGGGGGDAFLAKFNSAGIRQWSTYYGAASTSGSEFGFSCATDASGNVFICGSVPSPSTSAGTPIATAGSYQQSYSGGSSDIFLAKFNSSGVRQWGTFYGGAGGERAYSCATDASGNIYFAGFSASGSGISSPGSHQPNYTGGGLIANYLVKFSGSGARLWATYYGAEGANTNYGGVCATDASGNVYLAGGVAAGNTATAIASAGAYQTVSTGGSDGFLAKFNSAGVRQWGTFYGDAADDVITGTAIDASGNVYIVGYTTGPTYTSTALATPGSYQTTFNSATDGIIAQFSSAGARQWATYYGGSSNDEANSCATAASGAVYMAGNSRNPGLSTTGSHQPLPGGNGDAILVKFTECNVTPPVPVNNTPASNQMVCSGHTTTLSVTGNGAAWYATQSTTTALGSGTTYVTPNILGAGVYNYYAEATGSCGTNPTRTPVTFTVNLSPMISVNNGTICAGKSFTIVPAGAATYTISGGATVVSPTTSISYLIDGKSAEGCVSVNTAVSSVLVNNLPAVTAAAQQSTVCAGSEAILTAGGANSYVWNTGGTTATISVSPAATTNYTVTGTDAAGCTNTAVITQQTELCTGLATLTNGGISLVVFPNPNTGSFTIETAQPVTITIANALGQRVATQQLFAGKNEIHISAQATGIYFIQLQENGQTKNLKIIKAE